MDSLTALLELPQARAPLSELRHFLEYPAVAARFDVETDDLPRLHEWMQGAGIRWGLDEAHREALALAGCGAQNTARFGVERMLMGFACGAAEVASQFLTYDFLCNTVRVKGGAYGTGFRVSRTGSLSITSYRDPNPAQSLQTFRQTVDALRAFCQGEEDAERYIVSTIGDIDPLLTPRAAGETAALLYLAGVTGEELEAEWRQVLRTDKAALAAFADALEQAFVQSYVCVIGGQKTLDACGDALTHTEPLQA